MNSVIDDSTISAAKALNMAITVLSLVGMTTTVICAVFKGML
ncbi:hypothetical protein P9239_00205 [Caballeronia sp. LZ062]|nr:MULTISPECIES: hypothetical protein [unclassified Caballeronia]MDR5856636.1 hypothetical protein [Caballeronia sp. LZ050]MDR5868778.1 hypothetical protein [Caballeronia sp. LZ062]